MGVFQKPAVLSHKKIDLRPLFRYTMRHLSNNSDIMRCSSQSYTSPRLAKLLLTCWLLSIGALFFCAPCRGDTPALPIVPKPAESDEGGGKMFWVMLVAIGCGAAVGSVLLIKKIRRSKPASGTQFFRKHDKFIEEGSDATANPSKANPQQVISAHGARSRGARPVVNGFKPIGLAAKTGASSNGLAKKKAPLPKHLSGRNGNRKRRIFDYSKFYTDMVLQGPAPSIGVESYNGQAFDQQRPPTPAETMMPDHAVVLHANSELISNQKNLIEEQKRLMEEQARFIQEKSKLIAEKNQVLQRQSELIDNNLL